MLRSVDMRLLEVFDAELRRWSQTHEQLSVLLVSGHTARKEHFPVRLAAFIWWLEKRRLPSGQLLAKNGKEWVGR